MCSIFPFQNDLLGCSFSIQGLFSKIPVLFLQMQGIFKEEVIFEEFSRIEEFFQARANNVHHFLSLLLKSLGSNVRQVLLTTNLSFLVGSTSLQTQLVIMVKNATGYSIIHLLQIQNKCSLFLLIITGTPVAHPSYSGYQGSRDGVVVIALASHLRGPGSGHKWVKLVVGSLLCSSERFLSGFSGFPLPSKINITKFQFDWMQDLP